MKRKRKGKRVVKVDIRNVRFVPSIDTSSKVFMDKKRKSKNRRALNKQIEFEDDEESNVK